MPIAKNRPKKNCLAIILACANLLPWPHAPREGKGLKSEAMSKNSFTLKILPFPAKTCCFFVHGHCALPKGATCFQENARQCRILSLWERLQDRALEIAEEYRLDKTQTLGLVAENLEHAQDLYSLCPCYCSNGTSEALDCIFLHAHLCIQFLPQCTGACHHFFAKGSQPSNCCN